MVLENQFYTLLRLINHPIIKYTENQKLNFLKKINKSVLSHITFYLEDDDYKAVDFNGEMISFTCQLIKI